MHAVFLDQQTFSSNISLSAIEQQLGSLTCFPTTLTEQIIERCQHADIVITNKVLLNAQTLNQLPKLKLICIAATGTNNVDLHAALELGIAVNNVSGYSTASLSQYVFAQMLEYFNQTSHHNHNTSQGLWQQSPTFCHHGNGVSELNGKTLGIIGNGDLGQAVAKLGLAFGMQILIAERPNATTIRTGRHSFEQVLAQADVLSLHCPQTPETENLINTNTLSQMKPSAMLINTARGALVNSDDLLVALKTKQIAYAVLDVLEQEPPPADHVLLAAIADKQSGAQLNNLKITAHIAWASIESQQRLLDLIAENIAAYKAAANEIG
ncbi:D-2-hydroxyacid dehydrogenase [Paraglaciecola arctica]|uniref:Glycerate dehydrogenase n=1 Tax=Paraglaciecola arctica BSs20135 TaxID=493475 RepID=K6Z413_9ALTE|nr:D-2-hydroxyacid dehydrogenase [Paraglaciecola arctica]GAC18175.1 glycerate dehydrogenase [Paraglaciecola arctica BSs20135]